MIWPGPDRRRARQCYRPSNDGAFYIGMVAGAGYALLIVWLAWGAQ